MCSEARNLLPGIPGTELRNPRHPAPARHPPAAGFTDRPARCPGAAAGLPSRGRARPGGDGLGMDGSSGGGAAAGARTAAHLPAARGDGSGGGTSAGSSSDAGGGSGGGGDGDARVAKQRRRQQVGERGKGGEWSARSAARPRRRGGEGEARMMTVVAQLAAPLAAPPLD